MKKCLLISVALVAYSISLSSHAGILNILRMIESYSSAMMGIQQNVLQAQYELVDMQREMLKSQHDINSLMNQVNHSLSGTSGWGSYQFHDHQSYGDGAKDWDSVMYMASTGNVSGALGQIMKGLANEFPIDKDNYNRSISEPNSQKYYSLRSQTVLATRAASQLDYSKIQEQIIYQQMLQQQIERTKDLKAAVDLTNRLQVEANLINLEILRQSAIGNQQEAINAQAEINSSLANAKFLTK